MERREVLQQGIMGALFVSAGVVNNLTTMTINPYKELLIQRYPGIRSNIQKSVHDYLSEEDIRKMPYGMTSIAWNIWHMARAEDVGINRLITDNQQVFDQDNYRERLNISIRHFGTGMSPQEVQELSERINLVELQNYHQAVGERSMEVFDQLGNIALDKKLDEAYLHNVLVSEGVLHKNALWVEDVYQTKTKSWFLIHLALTHNFEHLGQIMLLRKLLGHKGTR